MIADEPAKPVPKNDAGRAELFAGSLDNPETRFDCYAPRGIAFALLDTQNVLICGFPKNLDESVSCLLPNVQVL